MITPQHWTPKGKEIDVAKIHYRVVEHDGGWAYKLGDVFSEAFPSRAAALSAAQRVALEQHVPGTSAYIEYQDETGHWHTEGAVAKAVGNRVQRLRRDDGTASGGEVNHALGRRLIQGLPAIDLAHADLA